MQILPFPHRFDRFRLIGLIFKHLRLGLNISKQDQLEKATGIDQTTISRFTALKSLKLKAKFNRKLNRKHLLAISRKGFGLSHKQASLLLWLAEGLDFKPWANH